MSSPDSIAGFADYPTGNVAPLLHEIRHALRRLVETGEPTTIDLRAMPLSPGEEEDIECALGHGEVHAQFQALGPSDIYESAIPAVWLVTHRNANDEIVAKFVEVTRIPAILESQDGDIEAGIRRLQERLEAGGDNA